MEWLVLVLLIPATIVPIVLLFGFAGCAAIARPCEGDVDCLAGTRCVAGRCVAVGEPGGVAEIPPSAPEALAANGRSDSEIELSWTTDDLTVTSFEVQRAEEAGEDLAPIADPTAQTFRDTGLAEGTTYLYQVRAFDGQEFSEPSDQTSATTFPGTPSNLAATPVEVDRIFHGGKERNALDTIRTHHELPFSLVQDTDQRIARMYGVVCWPTTISINADGLVTHVQFGLSPERREAGS